MDKQHSMEELANIVKRSHDCFDSGKTRNLDYRIHIIKKLRQEIENREADIILALKQDLGKSAFESYVSEIGFVYKGITDTLKNLKRWAKPKRVRTPLSLQLSQSRIVKEPFGSVLVISPFNYPFQLVMEPLVGALAAGNTVVVKPSEEAVHTARIIQEILEVVSNDGTILVAQGGKEVTQYLIHQKFDSIFFTGSVRVGKIVMAAAAENLVPVTLELGGKSPVVVDASANLKLAAKRIVWGKFLNVGQTCIAPDYLVVHESVQDEFEHLLIQTIQDFYGLDAEHSVDYGRIINDRHFNRLKTILNQDEGSIVYGGKLNESTRYIEPTLVRQGAETLVSMEDELFGPILPMISFKTLNDLKGIVAKHPNPLALYVFSNHQGFQDRVVQEIPSGGVCINDTISHIANHHLPFGGRGNSGMGAYHGQHSFDLFSHSKGVLKKSTWFEHGLTFPPYQGKLKFIKKILK